MNDDNDAWVEGLLAGNLKDHVQDAGFADAVLARLPPPKKKRRVKPRDVVIGAFALAAGGVGALSFMHGPVVSPDAPVQLAALAVVAALAVWGALASADA